MSAVLSTHGLTLGYEGQAAVRDLDLHLEAGEIVALLGANGAGKTTTLLGLSGLVEVLAGRVEVRGRDVTGTTPHLLARQGLAHVPEDRALFTDLTVRENLQLGRHSRRADIGQAVELCPELEPLLGRRAGLLSGGEQQMLAVARAVLATPDVLLVDEMSLGLAPLIVTRLLGVLEAVAARGCAVLLVEQHVQQALGVAHRGYVLRRGRIVLEGTAEELRESADLLAESYLGDEAVEAAAAAATGRATGGGDGG